MKILVNLLCAVVLGLPVWADDAVNKSLQQLKDKAGTPDITVSEPKASGVQNLVLTDKRASRLDGKSSSAVMLQGFHWYADNYWPAGKNGWWNTLSSKASNIGSTFDYIWIPPVSIGSYYPTELYKLDSQWGTKADLIKAVRALHGAGVKVIGDIVLNHRNGTTDWADFTNPAWPSTVVCKDDEWTGSPKSDNYDEGEAEYGARDIDHRNPIVQQGYSEFMLWLRKEIGVDGWRYDKVKGYPGKYVAMYNNVSSPEFSVGEYFDRNRQAIVNWMDATGKGPDASSAFDFATKYNLQEAIERNEYWQLNDNGKPSGLIGWWPVKAVTFVDNHDTAPRDPDFMSSATLQYKNRIIMAYAYILTHPGVPCVFWPHYYDWGQDWQNKIKALVDIRKKYGIRSDSAVTIARADAYTYAAYVKGNKTIAVKIGPSMEWNPGNGWTMLTYGEGYAVWLQQ